VKHIILVERFVLGGGFEDFAPVDHGAVRFLAEGNQSAKQWTT
jgi:hypothetical protein